MDGSFIKYSLDHKTYFKDQLPKIMHGKATPVVTRCMVSEMRNKGESFVGSALLAKRLKHVPCEHKAPVSSNECILSLLQNEKYCLATLDETLLTETLKLPHVPVIFYENNVMLLRKPSKYVRNKIQSELEKRKLAKENEIALAEEIRKKQLEEEKAKKMHITNYVIRSLKKKRKAKGPNPLSVKKKKPKVVQNENKSDNNSSTESSENKEKRKRKRKRSKSQDSNDQSDKSTNEEDNKNDNGDELEEMMPKRKKRKRKRKKKNESETKEDEIQLNTQE